jgi:hypothetical protein
MTRLIWTPWPGVDRKDAPTGKYEEPKEVIRLGSIIQNL